MNDLTPTEGARLLLELERDDGARAVYRAAIYTPATTYEGRASLADDGVVDLAIDATGGFAPGPTSEAGRVPTPHRFASLAEAPAELREMLEMLGKLTARAAAKKRDDGLPPWPARVLRWRGPGRGT